MTARKHQRPSQGAEPGCGHQDAEFARATVQENRPPEPLLQVSPTDDWTEMLKREREILNSYRWVDRSKGIVHIPIERAMELTVERKKR